MLKGFGKKTILKLKEHGINSYKEFLYDLPISYTCVNISNTLQDGYYIRAKFLRKPFFKKINKRIFTFFTIVINNTAYTCSYFGLKIFYAKVNLNDFYLFKFQSINSKNLVVLDFLPNTNNNFVLTKYRFKLFNRANLLKNLIANNKPPKEVIPIKYLSKNNIIGISDYLIKSHFPSSCDDLELVFRRREYETSFLYFAKINKLILETKSYRLVKLYDLSKVSDFLANLDFKLTNSQLNVLSKISDGFYSNLTFQKLVLGDVGTGKTIIAFTLAYISFLQGYSSIYIAPTEILAKQHFNNAKKLFNNLFDVFLITGSTSLKEKNLIYDSLEKSKGLLISTHAVFYKKFNDFNVGLIQIDEQHRFGVKQRSYLKEQFPLADVVYYSATPIPRSLAIFMFQEENILSLDEYPMGKRDVSTKVISFLDFFNLKDYFLDKIKKREQVIIVCSRILDNDLDLVDFKEVYDFLSSFIDPSFICMLHGKMKQNDKDMVYNELVDLKKLILISTTVVEVGVDLSEATSIFILNACRFGMSQLHQLRGRVGRSGKKSECFLVSDLNLERLDFLANTDSGYEIAEYDLKLRGPGDLFGVSQSGFSFSSIFKYSSSLRDAAYKDSKVFLLESSKEEIDRVLDLDLDLDIGFN